MSPPRDCKGRIGPPSCTQMLLPYADLFVVNSNSACYGSVERSLGIAAATMNRPEAEEHLLKAIERNSAIGASFLVAQCKEALGRYLQLQPARQQEAIGYLDQASKNYETLGLARRSANLEELIPQHEDEKPRSAAGLTDREIEVLRLIASGVANREIAARLFLSVRTVERHITNIYAKIGANGKADATAFAIRHELTD